MYERTYNMYARTYRAGQRWSSSGRAESRRLTHDLDRPDLCPGSDHLGVEPAVAGRHLGHLRGLRGLGVRLCQLGLTHSPSTRSPRPGLLGPGHRSTGDSRGFVPVVASVGAGCGTVRLGADSHRDGLGDGGRVGRGRGRIPGEPGAGARRPVRVRFRQRRLGCGDERAGCGRGATPWALDHAALPCGLQLGHRRRCSRGRGDGGPASAGDGAPADGRAAGRRRRVELGPALHRRPW
jgi:hypothetical protein